MLFHISLAIFFLLAACQLGAHRARAEWDQGVAGAIVGFTT
jgi:hypothetical protein